MKNELKIGFLPLMVLLALLCGCPFDSGGGPGGGPLRIEGYVRDELKGPVSDVSVKAYLVYADALLSVMTCSTSTDADGFYRIGFDDAVVEITVRPRKSECTFRPSQISYHSPAGPLLNENFTAFCGVLHTISGHVLDTQGDPVVGVAVTIRDEVSHWAKTVFSTQDGFYEIREIVPEPTYAVTPFLSGYTFDPPGRAYENLSQDFEDQDFVAAEVPLR